MKKKCCNNCGHYTEVYFANPETRVVERRDECGLTWAGIAPSDLCDNYVKEREPFCGIHKTRWINPWDMFETDDSPSLN